MHGMFLCSFTNFTFLPFFVCFGSKIRSFSVNMQFYFGPKLIKAIISLVHDVSTAFISEMVVYKRL